MPEVKLKFDGGECLVTDRVSLGRAPENTISFPDDSNVSRNHAEIERKGDYVILRDLGSSNGTEVNGQPITGEIYLWDGAMITLGGGARLEAVFLNEDGTEPERQQPVSPSEDQAIYQAPAIVGSDVPEKGSTRNLMIAGGAVGLAAVFAFGAAAIYVLRSSECNAKAVIVKPEPGDTISNPTEIELDVTDASCVSKAIYMIEGIEFASADGPQFSTTIDPKEFQELSDGYDHSLTVVLEDLEGNRIPQGNSIPVAFETRTTTKAEPSPDVAKDETRQQTGDRLTAPTLIDIHEMSKRLVSRFPSNASSSVSNREFLQAVQSRTAEYAVSGYSERAATYRDAINVAFVREQNLDAPLGFVLAMSRSVFQPERRGQDEGLWRMSDSFAASNGYKGQCANASLSDATQDCAAKAASLYMKALIFSVFDGDVITSVAAFGKSPQEAAVWKATLPPRRTDLWNAIKTPTERDQLVRFFAAGIVAENPERFGLAKDRPLTELYRIAM